MRNPAAASLWPMAAIAAFRSWPCKAGEPSALPSDTVKPGIASSLSKANLAPGAQRDALACCENAFHASAMMFRNKRKNFFFEKKKQKTFAPTPPSTGA
jgi:hypothetical protein